MINPAVPIAAAVLFFAMATPVIAGTPFPITGVPFFLALNAFLEKTAELHNINCLSKSAASSLDKLQSKAGQVQQAAVQETDAFMSFVSAPMPGTGKCDGGFEAVAKESEIRRKRTLGSLAKWKQFADQLAKNSKQNLIDVEIIFVGTVSEKDCLDSAMEDYEKLEESAKKVDKAIHSVQDSLRFEVSRFENYWDTNKQLQARCGQAEPGTDLQFVLPANYNNSPASADFVGKSKNGASDITGIREDQAKQKALEGADRSHFTQVQVHAVFLDEYGQGNLQSDVTKGLVAKLDQFAKLSESQPGGGREAHSLPLGAKQTLSESQNEAAQRGSGSVGSLVWDLPQDPSKIMLELNRGLKPSANYLPSKKEEKVGSIDSTVEGSATQILPTKIAPGRHSEPRADPTTVQAFEIGSSEESTGRNLASVDRTSAPESAMVVAGAEEDLFRLVHERYRSTELFRKAKVLMIPLGSFAPNIKR